MSGNSAWSRLQTAPIVSSRRCSCRSVAGAVVISLLQEGQLVLADLELVAVLELPGFDAPAVQERPVETALVLDVEVAVALHQHGVLAGDGDVVEEDVAVRRPADRRPLALRDEMLAGPAAAGADHERRAVGAKLVERDGSVVLPLLGHVAHRRLGARLLRDEQRAAPGAVVGGLRVLEAALGTVD